MKVKKLLSAIIAIAMMTASSVGVTAFAEEGTTAILDTSESQTEATSETSVSDEDAVAKIGDENYASLQSAIKNATSGQTVTLVDDVLLGKIAPFFTSGNDEYYSAITIGKDKKITLDLNHHSIKWSDEAKNAPDGEGKTGKYDIFWLSEGSELKVGGEGIIDGDVGKSSRWARIFWVKQGANLIIDSGEYYALQVILFNTYSGASATINGGTFGVSESYTNDEIANIINASGKNVLEKIYGGTFKGVDPRCFEDGDSAVAEGCKVSKKGDNYTVLSADTEAVASVIVPQEKLSGFAQSRNIGEYFYTSLADAVAAAQDGDTIDLLGNTVVPQSDTIFNKSVTVTNGTFDITGIQVRGDAIFRIGNYGVTGVTVTFDGINFVGSDYNSSAGVLYPYDGCTLNVKNSTFDLTGEQGGFGVIYANPSTEKDGTPRNGGKVYIENVTGTLDNTKRFVWFGDTKIKNATLTLKNFRGDAAIFEAAPVTVTGDSEIVVENSDTIFTDNSSGWERNIAFTVSDNSTVDGAGKIVINNDSAVNVDETSYVGNTIAYTNVENNITDEIAVNFVPTADENVYDIVLDGNYKEIYEFVSAEIQFINAGNGYQIDGTNDINVIPTTDKPDRYGFYLKDGAVDKRITDTKIKIGTVTFPEQGAISFKVDANNSTVVATEYNTHDEKSYTAADENSKLTADANGITDTIDAKTRNVLVKVDYAHELVGSWTYNKITVTLKNAFGETSDAMDINDGEEPFANVPLGRITVTLKAPGFRTFTYTTTVEEGTDPLVLSFWNDTKRDTAQSPLKAIEAGKAPIANNFVVGDIVMDYTVDKYDLAAVTSYYGTYNLTDENKIRCDLNRDGNIDITDVAYVLHNFGF